jgi:hypothetical protein
VVVGVTRMVDAPVGLEGPGGIERDRVVGIHVPAICFSPRHRSDFLTLGLLLYGFGSVGTAMNDRDHHPDHAV